MNRKHLYPLLIIVVTVVIYFIDLKVSNKTQDEQETVKNESSLEFGDDLLPTSTTGSIIKHAYFTLSYSENHEQAEWVAYELRESHIRKNDFDRPYFIQDKDVKTKSADWRNYKKSGYDRGHLCPAGDRGFNYEAYSETFLTSNISPQDHTFNAGIWNNLEQKVRYWAGRYDDIYVVTGGVLKNGLKTIGAENVSVPEHFYKVVLDNTNGRYKAAAFLIPQTTGNGSFYKYMTTVDEIEAITGIDFFSGLPDAIENKIEAESDTRFWK